MSGLSPGVTPAMRLAAYVTATFGSFMAWLAGGIIGGDWRTGTIVASFVALGGLAAIAAMYLAQRELGLYAPGLIAWSMVPVGSLCWAYLPERRWAWVTMFIWLSIRAYSAAMNWYRRRRMTWNELVKIMVIGSQGGQAFEVERQNLRSSQWARMILMGLFFVAAILGAPTRVLVAIVIVLVVSITLGARSHYRAERHTFGEPQ